MAADNLDVPSFGNFSIEDTIEMSPGSKELLDGLYSTETVTTPAEEVQEIKEEKKKVEKPKPSKEEKKETKEEEAEKVNPLDAFLEEEENEEVSEQTVPKKEKEGEGEEVVEVNRFTALSKDLFQLGVFSKDEEEGDVAISTPEEFLERFNLEKKKGAIEVVDRFIGQFGEDYQQAFDAIFVKGVDPREYFSTYNNIQDLSSLDLKDEANQEAIVKQGLHDQGFEPEDIKVKLEKIKNYGDLEDEAQRLHKVLVKKEAAKIAELQKTSETKLQQQASIKNQYIKNVQTVLNDKVKNKEFDGIPINPKLAAEVQDFLITDKYKTPSGETLTEFDRAILDLKRPENHERKVKVALLLKTLEKDPTLSTIQKAGISKKSDALFGELARQTGKSSVKTEKQAEKPKSWFS